MKNKEMIEQKILEIENTKQKEQKEFLAYKVASIVKDGQIIGFGSGTTSFLAVKKISEVIKKQKIKIVAVPTSEEIADLCEYYGIETRNLNQVKLDWAFDGTDEIDPKKNLIKGLGKCMFKEKINFLNSPKVYILADETKYVKKLGEKNYIPVECYIGAIEYVKQELNKLGALSCELVYEKGKLALTDLGNCIINAKFAQNKINKKLEKEMKLITGVIETGLFFGYKNLEIL